LSDVKRYEAIDGLRAFAAVGIVSMHVMTNGGFILPDPVHRVIGSMGEFVYLFMAVSGFSMCCGYYDRMLSGNVSIVDFYKRRFSKAFPFFALLCLIDFAISPSLHSIFEVFANMTLCFGLLPNPTMSVVGVGWFLGLVFFLLIKNALGSRLRSHWFTTIYVAHISLTTHTLWRAMTTERIFCTAQYSFYWAV
jgi:peptidoglycan/LPS O-acetylase OafA/YrhL